MQRKCLSGLQSILKFNTLQKTRRPDKRSASGNYTLSSRLEGLSSLNGLNRTRQIFFCIRCQISATLMPLTRRTVSYT